MASISSSKKRKTKKSTPSSSSSSTSKNHGKVTSKNKFQNILIPVSLESYSQQGLDHENEDRLWSSTSALKQQQSPNANRSRSGKRRRSDSHGTDDVGLFCCFDGHGGDACSAYLATHFGREFSNCYTSSITDDDVDAIPSIDLLSRTLEYSISESEDKFMNGPGLIDDSGACLIAVAVSARSIVCACVGDCRAVVGRNLLSSSSPSSSGSSVKMSNTKVLMRQLSTDQTGWENDERRRIEQMGGSVVEGRINGILEPSRTIGDADLKRVEPPSGLIAEPVITSFDPFDCWGNEFDDMCLIVATVSFLFCFCNNNPIELYLWGDSFKLMTFVIRFFFVGWFMGRH